MDAGSRTVIIGDSNAPVDFESLGTVISRTNHRNHFPPEKALYWAVATSPNAAHVRRSPYRLPRFWDCLVGRRTHPRGPDATRIAVGARPGGHGVLPRRLGVPRCALPGAVRHVAGPRLHWLPADVHHVRDARPPAHREMGRPRALALRPAARPARHRLARTRLDRTPGEGWKPVVGLRSLGGAANRVCRCLARPDDAIR